VTLRLKAGRQTNALTQRVFGEGREQPAADPRTDDRAGECQRTCPASAPAQATAVLFQIGRSHVAEQHEHRLHAAPPTGIGDNRSSGQPVKVAVTGGARRIVCKTTQ